MPSDKTSAADGEYHKETKEMLVLTSDASGGAASLGAVTELWEAQTPFLARVVLPGGAVREGEGRVAWLITDAERKQHGIAWPHHFKQGCIYRLLVRELIDQTVAAGMRPAYYNRLLVVKVLEENAPHDALAGILAAYRKPVIISDELLGEFVLDKDCEQFNGKINWRGTAVAVALTVSVDRQGTWTKALKMLRALFEQQQQHDAQWRAFAAKKLVKLANDWLEDGQAAPVTERDFAGRMNLAELAVTAGGRFTAYYHDDEMFAGHAISVTGSVKHGPKSADIEG